MPSCKCGFSPRTPAHLENHFRFHAKIPNEEVRKKHGPEGGRSS